ncbi:MAG: hypothetical protein AAB546_02370 [Patescibacteria group bacterium]
MKFLLNKSRNLLVFLVISLFALSFVYAEEPVGSYKGELDVNQENGVVIIGGPADSGFCGNGLVEEDRGEQCDSNNLNGQSCSSLLGNFQGTLACQPNCIYDTSKCSAVPQNNGGNNNGGGGNSDSSGSNRGSFSVSGVGLSCVEEWVCSDWSECSEGEQNRACNDKNNCNTTLIEPETMRRCESRQVLNDGADTLGEKISQLLGAVIGTGSGKRNLTVIFIFLFLLLAILVIVNAARKGNTENNEKKDIEVKGKE